MAVKNHDPDTHVVLFIAGFLGRGFNSPRLHHNRIKDVQRRRPSIYSDACDPPAMLHCGLSERQREILRILW